MVGSVPCVRKVAGSDSHSSRNVWTLDKSFTCSCLLRFGVLTLTQCQLLWSGALSRPSSRLEESL